MWNIVLVIVVVLIIRYFTSGKRALTVRTPDTQATMDILKTATVMKRDKKPVNFTDILEGCEIVAIYFSAHWCPPCRKFTPMLADAYAQMKKAGRKIEIVFVSSDRSEDSMFSYMEEAHGDWYTVKYDESARTALGGHFGVQGIPTLIVLKKDGSVITMDGRADVQVAQGAAVWDKWAASI